jgi:lactoylglutathione lyase
MYEEVFPILATPDLGRTLGFYRDRLGATVSYQFPAEGDAVYIGLDLGQSHLGISQLDEQGETVNDRVTFWVYATDCDAAIEQLRAAGVPVLEEPANQPWGERMATVADPDGNRVIIASRGA